MQKRRKTPISIAIIFIVLLLALVGNRHAWNKVWIDVGTGEKKWYVFDATHANRALTVDEIPYEIFALQNFLIGDIDKYLLGYLSDNYPEEDSLATESTLPYAFIHYGTDTPSSENDFVIESDSEMCELIALAVERDALSSAEYLTIEIFIPHNYCATEKAVLSSLKSALHSAGYDYTKGKYTCGESAFGFLFIIML